MTAEQFAYWFQGFAELNEAPPTPEQWKAIREHLELVFTKVTPPLDLRRTAPEPGCHQYNPPQTLASMPFIHSTVTC